MVEQWKNSISAQIDYLLNEEPSQSAAVTLSALFNLQDRLGTVDEIAPVDTEDVLQSLTDRLLCSIIDFSELKRQMILGKLESDTEPLNAVLQDLTNLLEIIKQGSNQSERELLKKWIEKITATLG